MVLLPEEAEMTLAELRQMAARQQHQIEAQQQLLAAKEQRLKFLKQQESRHHHLSDLKVDPKCLQSLRERVEAQELKLRHLKALHGQVEQQKTNNCNLGTELDSIRALFMAKEKELNIAANQVDELMRQLDEIRSHKHEKTSPMEAQLENMKRELMYQNKVTEDQNKHITQQQELITQRQNDIVELDKKIAELTQRLHRKKIMNQQLANQYHSSSVSRFPTSPPHVTAYSNSNVAKVEPMQRESQEPEKTRDDLSAKFGAAKQGDFNEFSLKKNDPKYQTLPYNTKFSMKGKTDHDEALQHPEDMSSSSDNSLESNPTLPFTRSSTSTSAIPRFMASNLNGNGYAQAGNQKLNGSTVVQAMKSEVILGTSKSDTVDGSLLSVSKKPKPAAKPFFGYSPEAHVSAKVQKDKTIIGKPALSKPVVPPKPTLPVKPIPPPRQTPSKERSNSEERTNPVAMAISVLQTRSSPKEKAALKYSSQASGNSENTVEPKIATYFPKPSETKSQEAMKRKTPAGLLPIKPKPLTIRKTPGIEPPKLKVLQSTMTTVQKKPLDVTMSTFKPAVAPYFMQKEDKVESNGRPEPEEYNPVPKFNAINDQFSSLLISNKNNEFNNDQELFDSLESEKNEPNNEDFKGYEAMDEEEGSSSPCDSLEECLPVHDTSNMLKAEIAINDNDVVHPSPAFRCLKGNLKTENSVRSPRRVSFDPLALLLDAALEGELELVKKTVHEVANPSAANDEGITALHNAICAGHLDIVMFLVDFGCDVNAPDSDGWTPLHCAASCNNLPMVEFLVERGACIFAAALSDHETAAEKCEEEGYHSCSEYLFGLQENMGIINNGVVCAVYDYTGLNADELSFKDGDAITILRNGDDQESEWWWSRLNDEEGYVPRNLLGLYPRITAKRE